MSEHVLVLDAATGGARAVVFDESGEALAQAFRPWRARMEPALAPFGRSYDPEALATALDSAALEALTRVEPDHIAAIACTGQRIACVFIDEAGEALYAGPNSDVRALASGDLEGLDDADLYARTGRLPPWIYAPARLRWFEAAEPATFARVRHVLGLPGWAAFRLTDTPGADATVAADLLCWDVHEAKRAPVDDRLPERAWPSVGPATGLLDDLSELAAEHLGLRPGIPVAVGCADTQAALLLGGPETLVAGSSAPLLRKVTGDVTDPERRLWVDPQVDPSKRALEANLGEMGAGHRWLSETLGLPTYEAFDALARHAPPGSRGATSHVGPRAMDLRNVNTGRPAGLLLPFGEASLEAPPGRAELARSYLESCAFAVRAAREWLDAVSPRPERLHLVGGLAHSALLGEILASVLKTPVHRGPPDATARGAAACALVAGELVGDLEEAVARLSREPAVHEPAEDYEDAFERWSEREAQLEEI